MSSVDVEFSAPETPAATHHHHNHTPPLHYAAGVTPYARHPDTGELHFLLAMERWGRDSETYSDFGGSAYAHETPLDTALRECYEETRGVLGDIDMLRERIRVDGAWFMKPGRGSQCYYHYLMPIAYCDVEQLQSAFDAQHSTDCAQDEKTHFRWFSLSELLHKQRTQQHAEMRALAPHERAARYAVRPAFLAFAHKIQDHIERRRRHGG